LAALRTAVDAPGGEPDDEAPRVVRSRRFGHLEVRPDKIITFPTGLIGFEEYHEYILVQPDGLEPLSFLVACDNPEVAFPILAADLCSAGYAPTIPGDALDTVGAGAGEHVDILAICTTAPDTGTLHANLRGPVVVNTAAQLACQVVLHDSNYSLRHLLGAR
jgi:flagellar assembly factor FliW